MSGLFENFGLHMLHQKIHDTGEGCCCLTNLPCEHCPSHPDAYPSELAKVQTQLTATEDKLAAYERLVPPFPEEPKALVDAAISFIRYEADMLRRAETAEGKLAAAVATLRDIRYQASHGMYLSPPRRVELEAFIDEALAALTAGGKGETE